MGGPVNDGMTIIDDPNPPKIPDEREALDAWHASAADLLLGRQALAKRRKRDRAAANVPRRNTPKTERPTTPAVTAVTGLTADLLGHAPRPRKAKRRG